jgi:hypothetical protein
MASRVKIPGWNKVGRLAGSREQSIIPTSSHGWVADGVKTAEEPNYSVTVNPKNVGKEYERYNLIRTDTLPYKTHRSPIYRCQ